MYIQFVITDCVITARTDYRAIDFPTILREKKYIVTDQYFVFTLIISAQQKKSGKKLLWPQPVA